MLRLIKWAYSLGVKNERHRIASYLQTVQAQRYDKVRMFDDELRNDPVRSNTDAKKRKIEKHLRQKEVDRDVISIIESIFHGEEKYERGASFMFPEREVK